MRARRDGVPRGHRSDHRRRRRWPSWARCPPGRPASGALVRSRTALARDLVARTGELEGAAGAHRRAGGRGRAHRGSPPSSTPRRGTAARDDRALGGAGEQDVRARSSASAGTRSTTCARCSASCAGRARAPQRRRSPSWARCSTPPARRPRRRAGDPAASSARCPAGVEVAAYRMGRARARRRRTAPLARALRYRPDAARARGCGGAPRPRWPCARRAHEGASGGSLTLRRAGGRQAAGGGACVTAAWIAAAARACGRWSSRRRRVPAVSCALRRRRLRRRARLAVGRGRSSSRSPGRLGVAARRWVPLAAHAARALH